MLANQLSFKFYQDFDKSYSYFKHKKLINTAHKNLYDYYFVFPEFYIDFILIWNMIQKRYYEIKFGLNFNDLKNFAKGFNKTPSTFMMVKSY